MSGYLCLVGADSTITTLSIACCMAAAPTNGARMAVGLPVAPVTGTPDREQPEWGEGHGGRERPVSLQAVGGRERHRFSNRVAAPPPGTLAGCASFRRMADREERRDTHGDNGVPACPVLRCRFRFGPGARSLLPQLLGMLTTLDGHEAHKRIRRATSSAATGNAPQRAIAIRRGTRSKPIVTPHAM